MIPLSIAPLRNVTVVFGTTAILVLTPVSSHAVSASSSSSCTGSGVASCNASSSIKKRSVAFSGEKVLRARLATTDRSAAAGPTHALNSKADVSVWPGAEPEVTLQFGREGKNGQRHIFATCALDRVRLKETSNGWVGLYRLAVRTKPGGPAVNKSGHCCEGDDLSCLEREPTTVPNLQAGDWIEVLVGSEPDAGTTF